MSTPTALELRWVSPLGASVVLFILFCLHLLQIAILTPGAVSRPELPTQDLLTSERTDTLLFGRTPADLMRRTRLWQRSGGIGRFTWQACLSGLQHFRPS